MENTLVTSDAYPSAMAPKSMVRYSPSLNVLELGEWCKTAALGPEATIDGKLSAEF